MFSDSTGASRYSSQKVNCGWVCWVFSICRPGCAFLHLCEFNFTRRTFSRNAFACGFPDQQVFCCDFSLNNFLLCRKGNSVGCCKQDVQQQPTGPPNRLCGARASAGGRAPHPTPGVEWLVPLRDRPVLGFYATLKVVAEDQQLLLKHMLTICPPFGCIVDFSGSHEKTSVIRF